jgi:succinyl-CoA synthetase beta subunit
VAVLSNVGGAAVLAVDACEANGLVVPEFSPALQGRIAQLAPSNGGASNPVDLGAEASAPMYEAVLLELLMSGEVDAVVVNFTPPLVDRRTDEVAAAVVAAIGRADNAGVARPVVASLLGADESGREVLRSGRFPVPSFTYPETAARALAHALRYGQWRRRLAGTVPPLDGVDVNEARRRLPHDEHGGLKAAWVTSAAAMDVLVAFGVPVARTVEAYSADEAGKLADEMAEPVALKVLGPLHKSEGGGVRLGLTGHDAVATAFSKMQESFGDAMDGALLQPMAPAGGVESVVGVLQDPSFGPLVLFGLGGVTVEVLGDHVSRLAPLTEIDAEEMVSGLRGSALLGDYRGRPAVDRAGLVQLLQRVSRLAEDLPEVAELDCNPVTASPGGVVVVDARLRVDPGLRARREDTRHLRWPALPRRRARLGPVHRSARAGERRPDGQVREVGGGPAGGPPVVVRHRKTRRGELREDLVDGAVHLLLAAGQHRQQRATGVSDGGLCRGLRSLAQAVADPVGVGDEERPPVRGPLRPLCGEARRVAKGQPHVLAGVDQQGGEEDFEGAEVVGVPEHSGHPELVVCDSPAAVGRRHHVSEVGLFLTVGVVEPATQSSHGTVVAAGLHGRSVEVVARHQLLGFGEKGFGLFLEVGRFGLREQSAYLLQDGRVEPGPRRGAPSRGCQVGEGRNVDEDVEGAEGVGDIVPPRRRTRAEALRPAG